MKLNYFMWTVNLRERERVFPNKIEKIYYESKDKINAVVLLFFGGGIEFRINQFRI